MAGLPAQRHRLAAGAGQWHRRHGPPPALTTASVRPPRAIPAGRLAVALSALLLAASIGRQALRLTSAGQVGASMGFAAVLLVAWAGWQFRGAPAIPDLGLDGRPLLAGLALGGFLLLPGLWLRAQGRPSPVDIMGDTQLSTLAPLLLWVVPAEELFLRALLQPLVRRATTPGVAVLVCGVLFALMHVPVYGWYALPLDLGVGLLIGWLRQETGSTAACVAAHVVADAGGWFLP